jgi:hypothetical protein
VFSEAVKPTFSDTVRLTFKQLVLNKRLRATIVCVMDFLDISLIILLFSMVEMVLGFVYY